MIRNNKTKWILAIITGVALSAFLVVGIPAILSDDSDRNKKQNLQPQELGEPPGYSYSQDSGMERSANERFGDLVDNNYETAGQARAGIPLVVGAGVVAGATAGYVGLKTGYNIGKYYSQPEDPGDVVNSTLRKSVHTDSIISAGSTESFYDNQDNSLTTIEGSLKQRLSQEFLKQADSIKSEAEAVTTAEKEASEYLRTTQNNIINSTNFFSQSVAKYKSRLDEANASNDIYTLSYDKKIEVSNETEFNNVMKKNNIDIFYPRIYIDVQDNITITDSYDIGLNNEVYIDLNGHTLDQKKNLHILENMKITIANGNYNTSDKDPEEFRDQDNGGITLTLNIDDVNIQDNDNVVNFANSGATFSSVLEAYSVDSNVVFNGPENGVNKLDNRKSGMYIHDITFNPSDVDNNNLKNTVKKGNTTYTAINISLSSSYAENSNAEMIVPYRKKSNGDYTPTLWEIGESIKIETTTSGISEISEPLQYDRALKTIENRDSLSDQAYTFVSSYAKDVWSNTLQPVANDPNKSIYDEPNLTENLSVFEPPQVTRNNTEAILTYYVGIYEGTTDPTNDRMTLINNDTGEKFGEGVIFSTDMNELTGNKSKIEEGDILDTTNVSNSLLVDSETGETNQLTDSTKYKVSNISSGSSVDVRTYDLKNTDLSEYAERLNDAEQILEDVKNEPEDGISVGLPNFGGNILDSISDFVNNSAIAIWFILMIFLFVLVLILSILS